MHHRNAPCPPRAAADSCSVARPAHGVWQVHDPTEQLDDATHTALALRSGGMVIVLSRCI